MKPEYDNLPLDFKNPGGFVQEVMDYLDATAVCAQPAFSLAAALALAGVVYGRRVQDDSGQRTNLFTMAVGLTSAGKDHPLKTIARILDAAGATDLRLGQVTSDSAIEWALKRQPRQIALLDEAGHFFAGVSDPAAKGSPQHAIKPALLELWSCAGARWIGKQRVPRDGKDVPPVVVDNPHLCLYGTTQPQILFDALSRDDLHDGWLARNLFFISRTRPKPEEKSLADVPRGVIAEILAWKNAGPVATLGAADDARKVFAAFNDEIYARMLAADASGDETNYLYGKALENARRVALILAVSRNGACARVEERDALFATRLVGYLVDDFVREVRENLAENADEKAKNRLRRIVARAGRAGIGKADLTRKTQWIRRTFRDDYLADLLDAGEIVECKTDKGGVLYVARRHAPRRA